MIDALNLIKVWMTAAGSPIPDAVQGVYWPMVPEGIDPADGAIVVLSRSGGKTHAEIGAVATFRMQVRVWAEVNHPEDAALAYSIVHSWIHGKNMQQFGNDGTIISCVEDQYPQDLADPEVKWSSVVGFFTVTVRDPNFEDLTESFTEQSDTKAYIDAGDAATLAAAEAYTDAAFASIDATFATDASVAAETSARIAADLVLASAVTTEAATRASADSTEATARASGDSTEQAARIAADALKADLASPTLTGDPKAPTASADDNDTSIATTGFVIGQAGDSNPLVNSTVAPGTSKRYSRMDHVHPVDTSRAAASHTHAESEVTNLVSDLALKAPLASPALTGSPTAPTQSAGDNSTKIATDAYVDAAVAVESSARSTADALKANLASPVLTGNPTAPTQSALDNSTKIATDAYVDTAVAVEKARALAAEALSELLANKDANSGYAGLNSSGKLKGSEFANARNSQASTYAILDADRAKTVEYTGSTSVAWTIAQAGAAGSFADGWFAIIKNRGLGTISLTPATSTIEGQALVIIPPGCSFVLQSDGTNFYLPEEKCSQVSGYSFFTTDGTARPVVGLGATAIVSTADNIIALVCNIEEPQIVSKMQIAYVANASGSAQTVDVGIADSLGNVILSLGATSKANGGATTYPSKSPTGGILFMPGTYFTCWTCSSATPTFIGGASGGTFLGSNSSGLNGNLTKPLFIKCGGSVSAGALPASLGTLTTSAFGAGDTSGHVPVILFIS